MTFSMAFILRTRLTLLNRRKEAALASTPDKSTDTSEDPFKEYSDSDPRFIYMT